MKGLILSGGRGEAPLEAIKTEALEQSARRPAYSVLDTTKFQRDTGVTLEAWQGALALYLVGRRLVAGKS
ncbi:MAG: sugar nucleotide-binding protein [Nitrospinae bacterium]|nr:sugar nucleotide-binding protein [Nitrospinota bacterium]